MVELVNSNTEVCADESALQDKRKVMKTQWYNSVFYSVADTLKTIAAVLTPVGLAVVLPTLINKTGTLGIIGALGAVGTPSLIIAGLSLLATVAAIGASYVASRYYTAGNFDALEVNAQHNAKYIVQELKKEAACQQQLFEQNQRADGKSWTQVTRPTEQNLQHAR